jgi:hypothetical protein
MPQEFTERKASTIIDMAGYEGCLFIFEFGTIIEAGVLKCNIYGNTTSATGGTKIDSSLSHTVTAANAALTQSAIAIDVYQPDPTLYRYLEASIDPDDQNAVILGITAIRYNGKLKPEPTTGLLTSKISVFPAAA